ncbi:hypothetical protein KCU90_g497, partial [Aureobasidium melanogenum]
MIRFIVSLLFLFRVRAGQTSPQQHRDDQREHDHFLVSARPERRIRLQQTDEDRTRGSQRIADQAADNRPHEALQTDQEAGVVVDGGQGCDEDAAQRTEARSERERETPRLRRTDADEPRAEPVHRSRAQRLAGNGAIEVQIQAADQHHRRADHPQTLSGDRQAAESEGRVGERRGARAFRTEHHEPEADHRKVHGHRHDQQQQRGCLRDRLIGEPVDERSHRNDDQQRQRDLRDHRQRVQENALRERVDRDREQQIFADQHHQRASRMPTPFGVPHQPRDLDHEARRAHRHQQPARRRKFLRLQCGKRQRTVRHKLPLRDKDHSRHREHQHQREREQRVNRAGSDAVLREDRRN